MKNILFLDIDGVLCSYLTMNKRDNDGKHLFKHTAVQALNQIIDRYDYHICSISGWNGQFSSDENMAEFLRTRGVYINSFTRGDHYNRYDFVIDYLFKNPCSNYLVVDDEAYGFLQQVHRGFIPYKRVLVPNRYRCLDEYDAMQVMQNWDLNEM